MENNSSYDSTRILKELQDSYWEGIETGDSSSVSLDLLHVLIIEFSNTYFALELLKTKEILKLPHITPVPCSTEELLGLLNLRGQIRPVYDIRALLGFPRAETGDFTRLILLSLEEQQVGILADKVLSIFELQKKQIEPALVDDLKLKKQFISGKFDFNEESVLLLDIEKIFLSPELTRVHLE